jgi:hypothetical protein
MGIRLLSGRTFTDADTADTPLVGIVNQAMAQRYWPGEDPLGHRIHLMDGSPSEAAPITIVGVVDNVRQMEVTAEGRSQYYLPFAQRPWSECVLLVRSGVESAGLATAVRREIRKVDEELALSELQTMEDHVAASLDSPRFHTIL